MEAEYKQIRTTRHQWALKQGSQYTEISKAIAVAVNYHHADINAVSDVMVDADDEHLLIFYLAQE